MGLSRPEHERLFGEVSGQGYGTSGPEFNMYPALAIKGVIFGVFGLVSLGVLAYAWHTGTPLKYVDEREYLEIALNVVSGNGYQLNGQPSAYRAPVWPLVLALFLWVGLPQSLLALVPAVAIIAAGLVGAFVGMRILRAPLGALAGLTVLLYPMNVYTGVRLYPQALATLLVLALWWAALRFSEDAPSPSGSRIRSAVAVGLIGSALVLTVPTLAFTSLAVLAWVVWRARRETGTLVTSLCGVGAFLAPVAIWTGHNAMAFGRLVPLTTSNGLNLLIGNNASATGSSGVGVDIKKELDATNGMPEVEVDQSLRNAALDWISQHPMDAVTLYFAKVLNYFSPYNSPVTASEGSSGMRLVAIGSFSAVLLCVALRLWCRRFMPIDRSERFFLGLFVANAFVMAIYFTRTRFRQPLDSILLIEAGVGIAVAFALFISHRRKAADRPPLAPK